MQMLHQHFHRPQNDRLLLFFTGWGMDELVSAHLDDAGWDIWTIYDYSSPVVLPPIPAHYGDIRLIAWSLGVWAAAEASAGLPSLTDAVAINGTLHPLDEQFGIAPAIFQGTIEHWLQPRARERFWQRLSGTTTAEFPHPRRMPDDQQRELQAIATRYLRSPQVRNPFRRAIISENDRIFSAVAQRRAWQHDGIAEVLSLPGAHAPFAGMSSWNHLLHLSADHAERD